MNELLDVQSTFVILTFCLYTVYLSMPRVFYSYVQVQQNLLNIAKSYDIQIVIIWWDYLYSWHSFFPTNVYNVQCTVQNINGSFTTLKETLKDQFPLADFLCSHFSLELTSLRLLLPHSVEAVLFRVTSDIHVAESQS